jgi:peptidyl-prolyl cis-trans isomerase D
MLEAIRSAAKTWVAKVVLVLITIPFALWGVESYIRTNPGTNTIASVGKDKISEQEFDNAVKNQLERYRQQFGGQIDATVMDNPELRKGILDQLIDQRLLDKTTRGSGMAVSDNRLKDLILNNPNFQDAGKFSPALYERLLKAQGYSAASFENLLRQDTERQQFLESVSNTAFVSKTSLQNYLQANEQSREVAIVTIAPEGFLSKVNITPEAAKTFYEKNTKDFTIPEQVRAEYVELTLEALAPSIKVPAEEIAAYYETNKARYVTKEERKASHILINAAKDAKEADKKAAEAKANDLFAQLKKSPGSFAELAKKNSQDPGSGANGGDLGFFGRGMMVPPFEKAVFDGKVGELLGPVLSDFGYHIIKVTDIKPEKGKSLADATPEIEGELKKQKASRKFAELAEKFSNAAFEQSASLKAASEVGIPLEIAALPIKQSAFFAKGQAFQPPFNNPKLSTALFSDEVLKNKRNTEAVEIGANSLVVARMLESKPAVVRPLAEVQVSIIQRLAREEAVKLAKADGEARLAALKAGKGGVTFPALLAVSRAAPGGLQQNVVEAAMRVSPQNLPVYTSSVDPAGAFTLIQVAKIIDAPTPDEAKLKATQTNLQQTLGQNDLVSLLAQMRTESDVSVKKGATDKKTDK